MIAVEVYMWSRVRKDWGGWRNRVSFFLFLSSK